MATYGVTDDGFILKPLEVIKDEVEQSLRTAFGNEINTLPTEALGQFVGIFSEREAQIWEGLESVYDSFYPDTSTSTSLDNVVTITGIERLEATYSKVFGTAYGTEGTVITEGSIVSVDGDADSKFEMVQDYTIGAGTDEVQTITFSAVPDDGLCTLVFDGDETVDIEYTATATDVENALNGLSSLSTVTVTGDFSTGFVITFTGTDGQKDQELLLSNSNTLTSSSIDVTITITQTTPGVLPNVACELRAVNAGAVAANAGSLTVIETVISGWDSFTNEEDAEVGKEIETDAELRLRREKTLAFPGACTVEAIRSKLLDIDEVEAAIVYDNFTEEYDSDGRSPKSLECVVLGGENQDIFDTIWSTKPASIRLIGDVVGTITDSQGFVREIKFSRPTEVTVYLEIDLVTNDNFPSDGEDTIVEKIIAYAKENFSIGDTVITTMLYCPIHEVEGIEDVTLRIGITASPTTDDNIEIEADEISEFDSGRITITIL